MLSVGTRGGIILLMFIKLKAYVGEYAKGKTWYWYVPMWLLGVYIFIKLLSFELDGQSPFIIAIPQAFDFMLHEMAHIMFGFAPSLVAAAAGSFSELLLGALLIWGAFRGRTYFASLFCFLWFMLACISVADYMADARLRQLPLVSLGGEISGQAAVHDWHYIFSQLNILEFDTIIAEAVRAFGIIAGIFGLAFSAWVLHKIAGASKKDEMSQKEAELLHEVASDVGLHSAPPKHFKDLRQGKIYPDAYKGRLSEEQGYKYLDQTDKTPENSPKN